MVLSTEEQKTIRSVYTKNASLRKTAKQLGYSPNTVKKYVIGYHEVNEQNIVRKLQSKNQRLIGTYVGLWMGDGTQFRDGGGYVIKICLDSRNQTLIDLVQYIFKKVFNCTSWILKEQNNNRGAIKVHSKFIYNWISNYCSFGKNKTLTVQLKHQNHSKEFLEGVLLGLMLSDGHLNKYAKFHVISQGLAENMKSVLHQFKYNPTFRVQERPGTWKTQYQVYLTIAETKILEQLLDQIANRVYNKSFQEIKKNDPPEI